MKMKLSGLLILLLTFSVYAKQEPKVFESKQQQDRIEKLNLELSCME